MMAQSEETCTALTDSADRITTVIPIMNCRICRSVLSPPIPYDPQENPVLLWVICLLSIIYPCFLCFLCPKGAPGEF